MQLVIVLLPLLISTLVQDVKCGSRKPLLRKPSGSAKTGCFIIAINEKATEAEVDELMKRVILASDEHKMFGRVQKATRAFTVKLSAYSLEMVRGMPAVDYIEEEGYAVGDEIEDIVQWHLDRLDQSDYPLDLSYSPIGEGEGVDIYVLDSGINYDHQEFEYRAKYAGYDPVDEYTIDNDLQDNYERRYGRDCHGHGTHVSSLSAGKTFGSARRANVYSVRVLACNNAAPWTVILDGLDYVARVVPQRNRPAVVSMSLSGDFYRVVNNAVANLVRQGIHVVTAGGNGQLDACSRSPASSTSTITVGGTRNGDGLYLLGAGTNFGRCIDIFSPGEKILAADWKCLNCSKSLSGTSMSTPIVSGVAAIHLSHQPLLTPEELKQKLIEESLKDVLNFGGIPTEYLSKTPNRLLHIPGACGGSDFVHSRSRINSPNYPSPYPYNLDCVWHITISEGQWLQINLMHINLEPQYDVLKLYESTCCSPNNLVAEFTGNYGNINFTHTSKREGVCLQLLTDHTVSETGFVGNFVKLYAGTDIVVPDPDIEFPTRPPVGPKAVPKVITLHSRSPKQTRQEVESLVSKGYKVTWITTHLGGPSQRHYFDVILTNHSQVDTRTFIDLNSAVANKTIKQMAHEGYSLEKISDRERGLSSSKALSYTLLFTRTDDIMETKVFLGDSTEAYDERLSRMNSSGFRIISHSIAHSSGKYQVSSIFRRDRRLAFNISIDPVPQVKSFLNFTFFEFTRSSLNLAKRNYYMSHLEVHSNPRKPSSQFSAIFKENTKESIHNGHWFRWGLDSNAVQTLITSQVDDWDPHMITGYNYLGNVRYFVLFVRHAD